MDAGQGRPIVGVRVVVGNGQSQITPAVWTDPLGKYELEGVEPGLILVTFQQADYAPVFAEVRVIAGQSTDLDVRLGGGEPIGGVVVDAEGEPLEGVTITATGREGFRSLGLQMMTGSDGRFLFAHAPSGQIVFRIGFIPDGPFVEQVLQAGKEDYRIELPVAPHKTEVQLEGHGF